ncbi:MAG: S9 family peptidase [Planctomyces sp.]|nr:S9 family peptidase [Planctomyces sp.]
MNLRTSLLAGLMTLSSLSSDFRSGFSATAIAQEALSLEQIMSDPDWIARSPESPVWSRDSRTIFYQRKREGNEIRDWYRISLDDLKSRRVSPKEAVTAIPSRGNLTADRTREVTTRHGDLFLFNHETGETTQLTRTSAVESSPVFLAGEDRILFRREQSLLIRDLTTGLETEPVRILTEDAPKPEDKGDQPLKGFLTESELELFDYLRQQRTQRTLSDEENKKREKLLTTDVPEAFYAGKDRRIVDTEISANERYAAIVVTAAKPASDGRNDRMPVWVREDAYVENREVRELVGTEHESPENVVVFDTRTRKEFPIPFDQLPEISTARISVKEGTSTSESEPGKEVEQPQKPRPVSVSSLNFSKDSKWLLFQCFSHDNKDRWIVAVSMAQFGKPEAIKVLHHRYDEAWINGSDRFAVFLGRTSSACFLSEESGYSHLYLANPSKGTIRQLTEGAWEVSNVSISHNDARIYFTANESHPGEYELQSVEVRSGERSVHTSLGGLNDFEVSPDETHAIALHSTALHPPELWLVPLQEDAEPKQLTRTTTPAFRKIPWATPEFVEIPSRHGLTIHARLYQPAEPSEEPRPAVLFVHGAGYLQNAHKGWSQYFREFMFHTLLTQRGFVVLDMDYRASAGYGRDWRTAIYRQMGTPELEDLEDGVEWLAANQNVDRGRVGVYGGSYGGFLTLMALFRKPDLFACGAALRPVTDWAHYNHGYTSNILNTPETDPEAYQNSSPIYFADGLQKPLLICHGMVDDNVFFKDTVRLTQRLIELKKDRWNVAMYPVEPHGFRQPSSWYDEYRRILELFEEEL